MSSLEERGGEVESEVASTSSDRRLSPRLTLAEAEAAAAARAGGFSEESGDEESDGSSSEEEGVVSTSTSQEIGGGGGGSANNNNAKNRSSVSSAEEHVALSNMIVEESVSVSPFFRSPPGSRTSSPQSLRLIAAKRSALLRHRGIQDPHIGVSPPGNLMSSPMGKSLRMRKVVRGQQASTSASPVGDLMSSPPDTTLRKRNYDKAHLPSERFGGSDDDSSLKSPPGSVFSSPRSGALLHRKRVMAASSESRTKRPENYSNAKSNDDEHLEDTSFSSSYASPVGDIMSSPMGKQLRKKKLLQGAMRSKSNASPVGDIMSSPMGKSLRKKKFEFKRQQLVSASTANKRDDEGFSTPDKKKNEDEADRANMRLRARHLKLVEHLEAKSALAPGKALSSTSDADEEAKASPREMARILIKREAASMKREREMKEEIERLEKKLAAMVESKSASSSSNATACNNNSSAMREALDASRLEDEDVAVFSDLFSFQSLEIGKMKHELQHAREEILELRSTVSNAASPITMRSVGSPLVMIESSRDESHRLALPKSASSASPAVTDTILTFLQRSKSRSPSPSHSPSSARRRKGKLMPPSPSASSRLLRAMERRSDAYEQLEKELDDLEISWNERASQLA